MTSRQKLYAIGEPLGECVTVKKVTGRIVCGGGGGSSSSASSSTTNTDNTALNASAQSGFGGNVKGDSNTITVNSIDKEVVTKALDTVSVSNALQNDGFVRMLGLADKLFTGAEQALSSSQQTTLAQVGALSAAQADAKGAIDQKTIVILAAAGVTALALLTRKK